jgi:hypothetical protein
MKTYRLLSTPQSEDGKHLIMGVHAPGFMNWALAAPNRLEGDAQKTANVLYLIACAYPQLPCGVAHDIATGKIEYKVDDDGETVLIEVPDEEEE